MAGPVDTPMTTDHPKNRLFVGPARAARDIERAIDRRAREADVPWYWRPILWVVRNTAEVCGDDSGREALTGLGGCRDSERSRLRATRHTAGRRKRRGTQREPLIECAGRRFTNPAETWFIATSLEYTQSPQLTREIEFDPLTVQYSEIFGRRNQPNPGRGLTRKSGSGGEARVT